MIKAKIVPINEIVSEIVFNIKDKIDNTPEVSVQMNIGKVTGISMLSNIGPKFDIKMETARRGKCKFIFWIYRRRNKPDIT